MTERIISYRLRFFTYCLLSIAYCLLNACASTQHKYETENYQPFFDYTYDRERNISRYNILGPFITIETQPEKEEHIYRPFYSDTKDKKKDTSNTDYIYPLGNYKKTPEGESSRFTPLYTSRTSPRPPPSEGGEKGGYEGGKGDFGFFPVFWGKTEDGEKYGGFFPIYGHFKKRFGKDEIRFFLWPVYTNVREDKTETTDIIWPIFSKTTGEKEDGFRIWPLFGYRDKEGEYSKRFFLWPLIYNNKTRLNTARPTEYKAFLPFYSSETSPGRVTKSVLWPFFNYLYDEEEDLTLRDFPWPIIQKGEGRNFKVFRVFPVFGFREKEESESRFFLWPIYTYEKEQPKDSEKVVHRFILISKYERESWTKEKKDASQLRFWPLFNYKSKKDGGAVFHFPEIIPIETEGFEKNYGPIFRLYEYTSTPSPSPPIEAGDKKGDEMESRLLWGLYSHKKNSFGDFVSLSFLVTYEKREDESKFSILKGLLEFGKKKDKGYFKMLYIPFTPPP
ncbi:MAG: hypothetical protein HY279_02070 [Nitrospinae bacterium]|nr:hypothetical protein [Nitrospinota bacterium]